MKIYTTIKLSQIGRGYISNITYITYSVDEEIYSLPELEDKIKNLKVKILSQRTFEFDSVDEDWNYICPWDKARYNEVEEYACISDDDIATYENTFFL